MTTRMGFLIILVGAVIYGLRAFGLVDSESADIAAVIFVVCGALMIAIDGEPRNPRPES